MLKEPEQAPSQELHDVKAQLIAVETAFSEIKQSIETDQKGENAPDAGAKGGQNVIFSKLMTALVRAKRLIEILDKNIKVDINNQTEEDAQIELGKRQRKE